MKKIAFIVQEEEILERESIGGLRTTASEIDSPVKCPKKEDRESSRILAEVAMGLPALVQNLPLRHEHPSLVFSVQSIPKKGYSSGGRLRKRCFQRIDSKYIYAFEPLFGGSVRC